MGRSGVGVDLEVKYRPECKNSVQMGVTHDVSGSEGITEENEELVKLQHQD